MIWAAVFFILMAVLLVAFGFVGGCIFQNWWAGKPTVAVVEDPYETIHMPDMTEVAATTAAIELVAYLPPILEPTPQPATVQAPILLGDVPLLAMTTDRDRWRAIAQQKDRLRGRYLRLLRVERARVRGIFDEGWMRSRKPTLARLTLETLHVSGQRNVRLLPVSIIRDVAAA